MKTSMLILSILVLGASAQQWPRWGSKARSMGPSGWDEETWSSSWPGKLESWPSWSSWPSWPGKWDSWGTWNRWSHCGMWNRWNRCTKWEERDWESRDWEDRKWEDNNWEGRCYKWYRGLGWLSAKEVELIKSTWETIKMDGDFAPKVFLRYFKADPEAQKNFPAFANVALSQLPTNGDFLLEVYTAMGSLNGPIMHMEQCPWTCPSFTDIWTKFSWIDGKKFISVWMTSMQEEMGTSNWTPAMQTAWENAFKFFADVTSNKMMPY